MIRKLTMKNPRMSEAMFAIANKYALAEEATLDTREQKKEESGHTNQPSSSKGHDKKRKADRSINAVERPWLNKEYRPRPGEFEGFLDRICIFHLQGKHKTRDYDRLQGFIDEVLKTAKGADQEKKLEEPKDDFPQSSQGGQLYLWWPWFAWVKEEAKTHSPGGHGGLTHHLWVP
jgi:hypothetical protein